MSTIQRETANKVINHDIELLINKFAENMEGIHTFSDHHQMQMYILIFYLTDILYLILILHCQCEISGILYPV